MVPRWLKIGTILAVVSVAYAAKGQKADAVPNAPKASVEISPEEKAAQASREEAKRKEDAEWRATVLLTRSLKQSMKNPDSFKLEQLLKMTDGSLCYTYRATNSFNAIIPGHAVQSGGAFLASGADGFSALWNKKCAKKQGDDLTHIRMAL